MTPLRAIEQIMGFTLLHLLGRGVGVGVRDFGGFAEAACVGEVPVADKGGEVGC